MKVIVVGAGLGGLTLAHGLRRAGIDVVVYERDGQRGRPQGISLHMDDRGATALRECLPPEHVVMVEATMGGPREHAQSLAEVDGQLAVTGRRPLDGTPAPGQQVRPRPGRQVHRPLLRAVLLTGLADTVRFGAEFTRFEQCADGTVRVHFADGRTDTADVLVGADGIGSAVRRQYLPDVRVIDTGKRTLMGATPLRAIDGSELPALIGHQPTSAQMRGTMVALGVLRFTEEPMAARERWLPALPLGAVADVEDYVMWALPAVARERLSSAEGPATLWDKAKELAADLHPALRSVVDEAWPLVTVALRIGIIPRPPKWPAAAVTLIGDAIHLAPGFGGNLALRDAQRLRDALVRAATGEQELLTAISDYEDALPRDGFPMADTVGPHGAAETATPARANT
ncbi:FAD-dependent monooxygenase [Actinomadura madurae]|uniref:FAD-dependent oxidoreductase n=1 Tax=Actinomadura madurae TaxID=1993 RepID=UPI00399C2A10